MELVILKQAKRELRDAPHDVISDVFALFEDLMAEKRLGMPISRPLPSIANLAPAVSIAFFTRFGSVTRYT